MQLRVENGQSQSGPSPSERTPANMAAMQPASDNGGQRKGTWSREPARGGIHDFLHTSTIVITTRHETARFAFTLFIIIKQRAQS